MRTSNFKLSDKLGVIEKFGKLRELGESVKHGVLGESGELGVLGEYGELGEPGEFGGPWESGKLGEPGEFGNLGSLGRIVKRERQCIVTFGSLGLQSPALGA